VVKDCVLWGIFLNFSHMKNLTIYHDRTQYLEAIQRWRNTPAVINPKGEMLIDGIPAAEWNAANPKPVFEVPVYENPDGTRVSTGVVVINKKRDTRISK
jgi:hypothetical protein